MNDLRKYIDIINEASNDKYLNMFTHILSNIKDEQFKQNIEYVINESIKSLKEILNREDFIIYMLKLLRAGLFSNNLPTDKKQNYIDFDMLKQKYNPSGEYIIFYDVMEKMKHFLSFIDKSDKIRNFRFNNQPLSEVLKTLETYEEEYYKQQSEQKQIIDMSNDNTSKKIISFSDGSAWFDLNKSSCRTEGDAMGHCGNTAANRYYETVLSYRVPMGDNKWKPHLTFILNKKTKMLGEMKGRNNDKPSSKYHPYIIELLKSDYITGILGGGYKPENNFSINDLPENIRDELLNIKPLLASFNDLIKLEMFDKAREQVLHFFENNGLLDTSVVSKYGHVLKVIKRESYSQILDDLGLEKYKQAMEYAKYIDGEEILDIWGEEAKNFIYVLDEELKKRILTRWNIEYLDEYTEKTEDDDPTFDEMFEYVVDTYGNDDEIIMYMNDADLIGIEAGSLNEMKSDLESWLDDNKYIMDERYSQVDLRIVFKSDVVYVILPHDSLTDYDLKHKWTEFFEYDVDIAETDFELSIGIDNSDISRDNSISSYDSDAALEYFKDNSGILE